MLGQGQTRRQQRILVKINQVVMFGMNAHQRAMPARRGQHLQSLSVRNPRPFISQKDLEAAMARGDQCRHFLLQDIRARFGQDHVEAIVNQAFLRPFVMLCHRLGQRPSAFLPREANHRGGAARSRRSARGDETICIRRGAAAWFFDMGMGIHAPRQNKLALGIQFRAPLGQVLADCCDGTILDADIRIKNGARRADGAATNDKIKIAHWRLSFC